MKMQNYVNMASALIVLIGGLVIIFMYSGLSTQMRVVIGLFIFLYFGLRMGQTILAIKRERRSHRSELKGMAGVESDDSDRPKSA